VSEKSRETADSTEWHPYSPHLTSIEVRKLVDSLESSDEARRRDLMSRMAWRPAWAIRSRRGSLQPFLSLLRDFINRKRSE